MALPNRSSAKHLLDNAFLGRGDVERVVKYGWVSCTLLGQHQLPAAQLQGGVGDRLRPSKKLQPSQCVIGVLNGYPAPIVTAVSRIARWARLRTTLLPRRSVTSRRAALAAGCVC